VKVVLVALDAGNVHLDFNDAGVNAYTAALRVL